MRNNKRKELEIKRIRIIKCRKLRVKKRRIEVRKDAFLYTYLPHYNFAIITNLLVLNNTINTNLLLKALHKAN
jgi:hypothetical protein